jgi:hypothetical protein
MCTGPGFSLWFTASVEGSSYVSTTPLFSLRKLGSPYTVWRRAFVRYFWIAFGFVVPLSVRLDHASPALAG